jgi:hypothetical protein
MYQFPQAPSNRTLNRAEEVERLMILFEDQPPAALYSLVSDQVHTLHNRGQVMLGLCGGIFSIAAFTGRTLSQAHPYARYPIISAGLLVMASTLVLVWSVLDIKWVTSQQGQNPAQWLTAVLEYRDRKTRAYQVAVYLLNAAVVFYGVAVAMAIM